MKMQITLDKFENFSSPDNTAEAIEYNSLELAEHDEDYLQKAALPKTKLLQHCALK